jgi:hypothetical protein
MGIELHIIGQNVRTSFTPRTNIRIQPHVHACAQNAGMSAVLCYLRIPRKVSMRRQTGVPCSFLSLSQGFAAFRGRNSQPGEQTNNTVTVTVTVAVTVTHRTHRGPPCYDFAAPFMPDTADDGLPVPGFWNKPTASILPRPTFSFCTIS